MDVATGQCGGEYFKAAIPVNNTAANVTEALEITAVKFNTTLDKDVVKTINGSYTVPKTSQLFTYDNDGNMTSDSLWSYTWSGENQLVKAEKANSQKIEFAYDYLNRRISKKNYIYGGSTWNLTSHIKFIYDDWNMIAEINENSNTVVRTYLWGLDLGGSLHDAGGIGGLLAVEDSNDTYFPAYDGNGNIMAYVNTIGQKVAEYEYDPCGKIIKKDGSCSDEFRFRFSTKYLDKETGLSYYGYRYYSPEIGRWISRDWKEGDSESKDINLYCWLGNSSVNFVDYWGLSAEWHHLLPQSIFTPELLSKLESKINIHSKEFGWILDDKLHDSIHGVEAWNKQWQEWFGKARRKNVKITDEMIMAQLKRMTNKSASIFKTGVRAQVSYSQWPGYLRTFRGPIETKIKKLVAKEATKLVAKKASKQGFKAVPFIGWGAAVIFFTCDALNPNITFGEAVQSNIPYYGVAYDAYTVYKKLQDTDVMIDAETTSTLYENGDRSIPRF